MTMRRSGDNRFLGEDGFSLVEVMVTTMLLGIILGAAYMALNLVTTVSDQTMARGEAQDTGQLALEKMVRELRQAQPINAVPPELGEEPVKFSQNTATKVSFYIDSDHNGTVERVTYTASGSQLTRTVANSGMMTPTPEDFGADSAPVLLATIDPSVTTVFQYVGRESPPNVVTEGDMVFAVRINLKTTARSGTALMTATFPETTVDIRAFDEEDREGV
jgi:prepilin-type N-terminal cleavage/methylation domain-containing protein